MSGRTYAGDTIVTNLSDSQLVILTAACRRADRLVLPLPDRLRPPPPPRWWAASSPKA
jgi:hypothetical protein